MMPVAMASACGSVASRRRRARVCRLATLAAAASASGRRGRRRRPLPGPCPWPAWVDGISVGTCPYCRAPCPPPPPTPRRRTRRSRWCRCRRRRGFGSRARIRPEADLCTSTDAAASRKTSGGCNEGCDESNRERAAVRGRLRSAPAPVSARNATHSSVASMRPSPSVSYPSKTTRSPDVVPQPPPEGARVRPRRWRTHSRRISRTRAARRGRAATSAAAYRMAWPHSQRRLMYRSGVTHPSHGSPLTYAASPTAAEKEQPESLENSKCRPVSSAWCGSSPPRKCRLTPARKAHAVHTAKARGGGGVGLVQKTTALPSILPSKSVRLVSLSIWCSRPMLPTTVAAASTASTALGRMWVWRAKRPVVAAT